MLESAINKPSLSLENSFSNFIGDQNSLSSDEKLFCEFFLSCLKDDFCPMDLNVIISGRLLITRRYQENHDNFYFTILRYLNELFNKTFVVLSNSDYLESLNQATLKSVLGKIKDDVELVLS